MRGTLMRRGDCWGGGTKEVVCESCVERMLLEESEVEGRFECEGVESAKVKESDREGRPLVDVEFLPADRKSSTSSFAVSLSFLFNLVFVLDRTFLNLSFLEGLLLSAGSSSSAMVVNESHADAHGGVIKKKKEFRNGRLQG